MIKERSLEGLLMCQTRRRKNPEWGHGFGHCMPRYDCLWLWRQERVGQTGRKWGQLGTGWELDACETSKITGLADGGYVRLMFWGFSGWHLPPVLIACGTSPTLPAPGRTNPENPKQKCIPFAVDMFPSKKHPSPLTEARAVDRDQKGTIRLCCM